MEPVGAVPGEALAAAGGPAARVASSVDSGAGASAEGAGGESLVIQAQARVTAVNEAMASKDVSVRFELNQASGLLFVVVDVATGTIIRPVLLDYFMKATAGIQGGKGAKGLLLDEGV